MAFAGEIAVTTALTQGRAPIGEPHEITECQDKVVIRLDERPAALEVFYEDIGDVLSRDPARASGYICASLPIKGSDTGDCLVRHTSPWTHASGQTPSANSAAPAIT